MLFIFQPHYEQRLRKLAERRPSTPQYSAPLNYVLIVCNRFKKKYPKPGNAKTETMSQDKKIQHTAGLLCPFSSHSPVVLHIVFTFNIYQVSVQQSLRMIVLHGTIQA